MSRNVETAQFGRYGYNRNMLINGNYDLWQRATSQAIVGYKSADRWAVDQVSHTFNASQQAFTVGQTDVPFGPSFYYQMNITVAGISSGDYILGYQSIEDVRILENGQCTVSFWAKASAPLKLGVSLDQNFGSGGSTKVTGTGQSVTLSTSWEKFELTFDVPSISGKILGVGNNLQLVFWYSAGATFNTRSGSVGLQSGTFDISQVKVERGPIATPFNPRLIGDELSLAQRYYEIGSIYHLAYGQASAAHGNFTQFQVEKRAAPTMTTNHVAGANINGIPVVQINRTWGVGITENCTATATCWFWADWTAEAEL